MIIDVTILYHEEMLTISSVAGKYSVEESANVMLTKTDDNAREKIASVGRSIEELKSKYVNQPGQTHRFVNPFNPTRFQTELAANVVNYYCIKIHSAMNLPFADIRRLLKIDKFDISVDYPNARLLSQSQKDEFIKAIKSNTPIKNVVLNG